MIGKQKLLRLLYHLGRRKEKLKPSTNSFRFVDTVFESLGTTVLPAGNPRHVGTIFLEIGAVDANVLALLGLDAMDKHSLTPCIVTNTLVKRIVKRGRPMDLWSINLAHTQSKPLFAPLKLPSVIHFTQVQLHKVHRQLFRPSPDKLFNLIEKARAEHGMPEIRKALKEITARYDTCQRIKAAPLRFRIYFGSGNVRFNERIIIDIMNLEGDSVLHIVNEGTLFSVAKFLTDTSTRTILQTIPNAWATVYSGKPNCILVDHGSSFDEALAEL